MTFNSVLEKILPDPTLHGRFLNTLSLLEYIGARKILKSQSAPRMNPYLIAHAAEEIRHSQILKKLAVKLGASLDYEESALLQPIEARAYIQGIDHCVAEVFGKSESWACYLYTTLLIEERALEFYPVYEQTLSKLGLGGQIAAILRDEEQHLAEMRRWIEELPAPQRALGLKSWDLFKSVEHGLFEEWMHSILQMKLSQFNSELEMQTF